jgi:hypothetical protein
LPELWGNLEELERRDNLLFVLTANLVSAAPYPDEYANGYCKQWKASLRNTLECNPCPGTPMYLFDVSTKRILLAGVEDACTGVRNSSPHLDEIPQISFVFARYRFINHRLQTQVKPLSMSHLGSNI